jgi:hypothetical protein
MVIMEVYRVRIIVLGRVARVGMESCQIFGRERRVSRVSLVFVGSRLGRLYNAPARPLILAGIKKI